MIETYLRAKMVEAFDHRAEAYEKIKTPEDCAAHQQRTRDFCPIAGPRDGEETRAFHPVFPAW